MTLQYAGFDQAVCSGLSTLCAGAVGLMMLARVSVPFTPLRVAVLATMTLGMVLAPVVLGNVFYIDLAAMTLPAWGALAALILLAAAVVAVTARLVDKKFGHSFGLDA